MTTRARGRLAMALVLAAVAGCTDGQIRADVVGTFDALGEEEVEQLCTDLGAIMGDEPSREAFEAAIEGIPDEELGETIVPADLPGVPERVHSYDVKDTRTWMLATWDECAERGQL